MEVTFIIIDDNPKIKEHALLFSIEDKYKNVKFFMNPTEGLNYVKENLEKNQIVLLDIQFPERDRLDGHSILKEIYSTSSLIPVILWSGINETKEEFSDFINHHAFGFISKTATLSEGMEIVDKAYNYLDNSLSNTIEDWILKNDEDKDKPIYMSVEGQAYSLNDILQEIRRQTTLGREFANKLNTLSIDLLLRGKKEL